MLTDKEQKKEFKKIANQDYKKYYPVDYLVNKGFQRNKCANCNINFWSLEKVSICGDPACSGGFRFINNSPAKTKLDFLDVWKEFSSMFKKMDYTPINRYPVVARWNPTMEFTIASIAGFQPYVVSGEVKPPANPLTIPQFCLRFVDIDNVGITGSHNTGFVMIGQHTFVEKKDWNQEKYFQDIHQWLKVGLGLKNKDIKFHEDAWAGGGNFGPCMEFFSGGVELGNQVYMMYEQTPSGPKELKLKILDMGMGQERNAWFSQGCNTMYDATFPTVIKKLESKINLKVNKELFGKFVPYAGYLNIDEVEDINNAWKQVAKFTNSNVGELRKTILPLSSLYSIAEHTRALLVALNDGALPSNVGGGYNLRILYRRAMNFVSKYNWDIDLNDVCEWHANYLKPQYPELSKNLNEVYKIMDVEKEKFKTNKIKTKAIVEKIIKDNIKINNEELIKLYDTDGIPPDLIEEELIKVNRKIEVPQNFYSLVAAKHEKKEQDHSTKKDYSLDLENIPETVPLFYQNYRLDHCNANVLKIKDNFVILNQTVAYATSGGQINDLGTINNDKIIDVFKQGNVIVHKLESKPNFKVGDEVIVKIDLNRRLQLAKHHTATHIINAAARRVLGGHINQAGAKKTTEKAHIDITHYTSLTNNEIKAIEEEANKIIKQKIPVKKEVMLRNEAEEKFGFSIYQGPAVPGNKLRIINIENTDVECCGGTHLDNTSEAEIIKIIKATKISDSIVRIEFKAGKAALQEELKDKDLLIELANLLDCEENQIPGRSEELFTNWKKVVKKKKEIDFTRLTSKIRFEGDIIKKTSEILNTQPEYLVKTIRRFIEELKKEAK